MVSRTAKKGGWLAVVDYHPFFLFNGVPTHFRDKSSGEDIAIRNFIHSLSDHFNCAKENGFGVEEFRERYVMDDWIEEAPSMEKYRGQPVSFLMLFLKK